MARHILRFSLITLVFALVFLPVSLLAAITPIGNVEPDIMTWGSSTIGYIGRTNDGTVVVDAGSSLTSRWGVLGESNGITGAATVTDAGSTWTVGQSLVIGYQGFGSLAIEDGGLVSSGRTTLGSGSGAQGTATVSGSRWINSGGMFVGSSGNGSLTVIDGGKVETYELQASFDDLHGDGTIIATKGAVLDADLVFDASHGPQKTFTFGSGGTLNVTWNGGALGAGFKHNGGLTIADGVNIESSTASLGYRVGSFGTATVGDPNTTWTALQINVGDGGIGELTVEAGAQVISSGQASVGWGPDSVGTATISGAGSQWSAGGRGISIGASGNGSVRIEAGANLITGYTFIGSNGSSKGDVTVTGTGSQLASNERLTVGGIGRGTLSIDAGGQVHAGHSIVGSYDDSTGEVKVTGDGSQLSSRWLTIGSFGSAALDIVGGGLVDVKETLTIDFNLNNDSFLNMATGGMLALAGDADDSLTQFLDLVQGTDAICYWDTTLADWSPLTAATYGTDYTLEYLTTGDLAGYTLLTVGRVGDFDNDGDVDGRDFLAWQRNPELGSLADWQNAYGSDSLSATAAVPEPSCLALLLGLALLSGRVRAVPS